MKINKVNSLFKGIFKRKPQELSNYQKLIARTIAISYLNQSSFLTIVENSDPNKIKLDIEKTSLKIGNKKFKVSLLGFFVPHRNIFIWGDQADSKTIKKPVYLSCTKLRAIGKKENIYEFTATQGFRTNEEGLHLLALGSLGLLKRWAYFIAPIGEGVYIVLTIENKPPKIEINDYSLIKSYVGTLSSVGSYDAKETFKGLFEHYKYSISEDEESRTLTAVKNKSTITASFDRKGRIKGIKRM
jgi:hypothetical protein